MLNKILNTINKYNLIQKGDKIVIGVSGGPDSMCLLDSLYCLKEKLGIEIFVAHINHMIREEADEETEYVKEYCKNKNIKCYVKKADVEKLAKEQKLGTEEMGRKIRYEFFNEVAQKENANKIATAHNLNDNVETVLMNILRGSGISGLKGIEISRKETNIEYIRPIRECERQEIEKYCEEQDLDPRIDKTNFESIYNRNKIRNEEVFNAVIDLLCSQIGCYVSPNKIANTLVSNGFKTVDNDTVSNYLKYLCDAFLFYKAVRYDLKGKEYLKTLNKYYICDLGLRNQRLGYRQMEMTHIIENIVYLELLRRNYQVDIGKNKESEIDFVVRSHDDLYYIQVSLSIENESTRMREENAFKGLDDGYKKIIITMDNNPLIHLERGYKMLNLFDFLLNENILKSI